MENQYLEEFELNATAKNIKSIASKYEIPKDIKPKRRGGLNEITDLRDETAKMLEVPIGQIYGLTKGWSKDNLRDTLKICKNFINPGALWWKIYKEKKNEYGRNNKKTLLKNREERRKHDKETSRQKALFPDG